MPNNNTLWEFNRGEWTEAYVFLRLLSNGRIYGATNGLECDPNVYIDIVNILRYEAEGLLEFERTLDSEVKASCNGDVFKIVCCEELCSKADLLYNAIKEVTSGERKLSIPDAQRFLQYMKFTSPKAPKLPTEAENLYGKKTDIIITSEDPTDHARTTEGYSIKSHIGSPSTLFNCSSTSGIIYEVNGCDDEQMHTINGMTSELGIFNYIKENPALSLTMYSSKSDAFRDNLDYIELTMLDFISTAVLVQVGYLERAISSDTKDIIARVAEINPIGVRNPARWYEAKFKDFLFAAFSGMTATEPWDGRRKISGGYIDVSRSGEILYYRAVSDDIFSSYLFEHTFIDRPSRGINKDIAHVKALAYADGREATPVEIYAASFKGTKKKAKKGDWGYVYKKDGHYYIAINFQIRFK